MLISGTPLFKELVVKVSCGHRRQSATVLILKKIYVFARLLFNIRTVGSRPMTKAANKKPPLLGTFLLCLDRLREFISLRHLTARRPFRRALRFLSRWLSSNDKSSQQKNLPCSGRLFVGCFAWIRTKINGVRVRCPTIRRQSNNLLQKTYYAFLFNKSNLF